MLLWHQYTFFCEVTVQMLCPFFKIRLFVWLVFLSSSNHGWFLTSRGSCNQQFGLLERSSWREIFFSCFWPRGWVWCPQNDPEGSHFSPWLQLQPWWEPTDQRGSDPLPPFHTQGLPWSSFPSTSSISIWNWILCWSEAEIYFSFSGANEFFKDHSSAGLFFFHWFNRAKQEVLLVDLGCDIGLCVWSCITVLTESKLFCKVLCLHMN